MLMVTKEEIYKINKDYIFKNEYLQNKSLLCRINVQLKCTKSFWLCIKICTVYHFTNSFTTCTCLIKSAKLERQCRVVESEQSTQGL